MKLLSLCFSLLLSTSTYALGKAPCLGGTWVYKNYKGRVTEATRINEVTGDVYVCHINNNGTTIEQHYKGVRARTNIVRAIVDDHITHYIYDDSCDEIQEHHEFEFGAFYDILTRATFNQNFYLYNKGCGFEESFRTKEDYDEL